MIDDRNSIIKMVQRGLPLLKLNRSSEAFRVIFQTLPIDKENVLVVFLNTLLKLMRNAAFHGGNDLLGTRKRGFKLALPAWHHIQHDDF
jgi:hypothetical protein